MPQIITHTDTLRTTRIQQLAPGEGLVGILQDYSSFPTQNDRADYLITKYL